METGNLNPAFLPRGTLVGPWCVLGLRGRGTYGAVYLAVRAGPEAGGPVALKLALYPQDARFAREAELLSRVHHAGVPRLLDHGEWRTPAGTSHPYLAMEWVEGVPLYEWARERIPSSRQVLKLLAALARSLEATHAAGGVHRDVKGGNVLVRSPDDRVFLTDFGSGHYRGASTLTWQSFPPGTPAYRSPEAWRFVLSASRDAAPYAPNSTDDVFALGVTAYRLVTEEYPPSTDPSEEESRPWHQDGTGPRPASECNPRCCPELSTVISRMLSPHPEARGNPRVLAEAMEEASRCAGMEADAPLFVRAESLQASARRLRRRVMPRATVPPWRPWLVVASVGGTLVLGASWMLRHRLEEETATAQAAIPGEARDGGTVAVGDSVLTAPESLGRAPSVWSTIAEELPPKPLPGQTRPNANGHCPRRTHVPIHGGCWIKADVALKDCDEDAYVYKGSCYTPAFPPARPSTSSPTAPPDAP